MKMDLASKWRACRGRGGMQGGLKKRWWQF